MDTRENLALLQTNVADFFHDLSRIMVSVDQRLREQSFVAIGDPAVFQDVSAALDRSSRWIPKYLARAYVKGKKPTRAIGYCIHLGPYTDPTTVAYLDKSRLALPFVSIACLKDMQPGPLEVDRRQIWDRLWDSGWWATYEDQVTGPLRSYSTTKEISGFQATIIGALTDPFPLNDTASVTERIVTPLLLLFEDRNEELRQSPHLLVRP
jgi:hypothetical protein